MALVAAHSKEVSKPHAHTTNPPSHRKAGGQALPIACTARGTLSTRERRWGSGIGGGGAARGERTHPRRAGVTRQNRGLRYPNPPPHPSPNTKTHPPTDPPTASRTTPHRGSGRPSRTAPCRSPSWRARPWRRRRRQRQTAAAAAAATAAASGPVREQTGQGGGWERVRPGGGVAREGRGSGRAAWGRADAPGARRQPFTPWAEQAARRRSKQAPMTAGSPGWAGIC